jgi:hypothetical protein
MKVTINGTPKVDSLKVSIQLIDCEIIDTNLIDRIRVQTINEDTGELIKSDSKHGTPTILNNADGTYIKFWKEGQFFYDKGQRIPTLYLTFLINSKHLRERYFEGITLDTLPLIYDYLMSFNVVKFSYDTFLNSRYNDTDICVDFNSTPEHFEGLKTNVKSLSSNPELWLSATNQENNSGIWSPTRNEPRANATPSKPFIKFYSKDEDFTYQSTSFAQTYIDSKLYKDLYRVEATIKNSKHKAYLGISGAKTFGAFLHLDLQLLLQQLVKEYFKNETKLVMNSGELTPIEKVLVDLMNELTNKGATNSELFAVFNRSDVSRQAKGILKEKYHKLTSLDEFNRKQLDLNSASKEIFSYLGIEPSK